MPAKRWRCLRITGATMTRPNYLYALPPQKLSPSAAAVRDELRLVVRQLVESGRWSGVKLMASASAADRPKPRAGSPGSAHAVPA